ncbi:SecY-interacting protein Syd [Thermoactinomyces sp. CICC 10520]|nr:SecY-interacting protein Syd [Thermoactinomyces sp. CICC 10520]
MKEAMKTYFARRKAAYDQGAAFLFKTPRLEGVAPLIYEGEEEEEGCISWKPVEKHIIHDFTELENQMGAVLHPSIKPYFNSYWFAELDGFIENDCIHWSRCCPRIELDGFAYMVKGYRENHPRLEHIPLGMEGNGRIVVVDNQHGTVRLEDFERNSFTFLADDIPSLLTRLRLRK